MSTSDRLADALLHPFGATLLVLLLLLLAPALAGSLGLELGSPAGVERCAVGEISD